MHLRCTREEQQEVEPKEWGRRIGHTDNQLHKLLMMVHNQHVRREQPMMTLLLFDSPSAELPQNLLCDNDMISQRRQQKVI